MNSQLNTTTGNWVATTTASTPIGNSIYNGYSSNINPRSYYTRDLSYDDIFDQVSDKSLPIIDSNQWDKIKEMLGSPDIELIEMGFSLLEGHRFPPGVINLQIINTAINNYLLKGTF